MRRWLIAMALIFCTAGAQAEALVSPPPLNNSNSGIMFDMTALNDVTVTGFTTALINNTTTVGTHTFSVFTKAGTHVGAESTPGAWTFLGTSTFTLNPGQQNRTFGFPISVPIAAGTTQAFYLSSAASINFRYNYRSQNFVGDVVVSDANLELRIGSGVVNFGVPILNRAFVGTAIYRTAATLPDTVTAISGTPQSTGVSTAFASLAARVTGPGGPPLPGITVTFAAPGAGASAALGAPSCVTDAVGECSVTATANATAGAYNVQASVAGVAGTASFALTNLAAAGATGVTAVPTLSEWAMALLAALLAATALRRRA